MLNFTQIAHILGQDNPKSNTAITHYSFDSRLHCLHPEHTLFVAIRTADNDGHKYIKQMFEKGVTHFLVDDQSAIIEKGNFILVENTLNALQQLAKYNRKNNKAKVIGVTGSNGKTICKDVLGSICVASGLNTVISPRSFNSQLGVALSLLQISADTDIAIIEAGISKPGEMGILAEMIDPDIGICTHLGDAHDLYFDSTEQKIQEKTILFNNSSNTFINANNKHIDIFVENFKNPNGLQIISYMNSKDGFELSSNLYKLNQLDDASLNNAALATAVALQMNLGHIQQGLDSWVKPLNRLSIIDGRNQSIIINDTYTNDYEALSAAINFTINNGGDRNRVAIITAMENANNADDTIQSLQVNGFEEIITIGFKGARFATVDELMEVLTTEEFSNKVILVKGLRKFRLDRLVHWLEAKKNATQLEIKLDNLKHNYDLLKRLVSVNVKTLVMLKAQAYGSGAHQLARFLKTIKPNYIGVAHIDEAVQLRNVGVTQPILILYTSIKDVPLLVEYELHPVVYSLNYLEELTQIRNCTLNMHIEFDTGMHRLGFYAEESEQILELLQRSTHKVAGIMSHLSSADDEKKDDFTEMQIANFEAIARNMEAALGYSTLKHICNSIATERFPKAHMDMVRLGIGMYGFVSENAKPITQFNTQIIQIKDIPAGQGIGYGNLAKSNAKRTIAIIPVGYADGFDRGLGNGNWKVIVNNMQCPTIGNICMDMTMIDVSNVPCKMKDAVILFGDTLKVEDMAKVLDTIPYEIVSRISERVKRIYLSE